MPLGSAQVRRPGGCRSAAGGVGQVAESEVDPRTLRLEERQGAVVLLSGGLDSATVLAIARARGLDCHVLTVDYGQRHAVELEAARRIATHLGAVAHRTVKLDLRGFGGSALTDDLPVPTASNRAVIGSTIPITYVPARNTILLALALAWAEAIDVRDLYIGANARDYSGYPDCRPQFLEAFQSLANLATRAGVEGSRPFRVHAPLVHATKGEIIRQGAELGVPFRLTHSCYDPATDGRACGLCEACVLRRQGFRDAGMEDPTIYVDDG